MWIICEQVENLVGRMVRCWKSKISTLHPTPYLEFYTMVSKSANNQLSQINRILPESLVNKLLEFIFVGRPIKLLKTVEATGHHNTSVPWVYYVNEITGQKFATFVSLKDLLVRFYAWLETVNLMAIALVKRLAISEVIFRNFIREDMEAFHKSHGWVTVISCDRTERLGHPRCWIETQDGSIEIVEPCQLTIF
jgi:hypothetical protein